MLSAVLSLVILGLAMGVILAVASICLAVKINPLIEKITETLPGLNCGACGFAGCAGYATAIVETNVTIDQCAPGGTGVTAKIATLLGQEPPPESLRQVVFVYCQGGTNAKDAFEYNGTKTCQSAVLVNGGQKQCQYGCLGFGDCLAACTYDAIQLNKLGVPVIDPEKCINCKKCIAACPKHLISNVPHKQTKAVICSSHDNGKVSRSACTVSCIACNQCVKVCPFQAITLQNNLAVIDPVICTNCGLCVAKCPTKAIA